MIESLKACIRSLLWRLLRLTAPPYECYWRDRALTSEQVKIHPISLDLIKKMTVLPDDFLLDYLQELLKNCPHTEITFNDDPDVEDKDGMAPLGFTIRVEGCKLFKVTAPTLREAIEKDWKQSCH